MKVELLEITPNPERLIETAGRTAYLSFGRQTRASYCSFIRTLIRSGHLSVLEHASATFRIRGGSRSFTHQLVRHRLCSYTQQSQRHVDESGFHYVEPDSIKGNKEAHALFLDFVKTATSVYRRLQEMGVQNEDARFVLPNAVESEIVITANFREWRHIIELRGSPDAQWEIRKVAIQILKILKKRAPTVFGDFRIDEKNQLVERIQSP